jgi:uracil DNA glycosylase
MSHDDPLRLADMFDGAEAWGTALLPVLRAQPDVATFLGPQRSKSIVPVRELTFQALKPHTPAGWKVVVFGQNPYPRVESATGIAMFDNTFSDWKDSQFGKVTSVRCIIKAAAMWKHEVPKSTSIADIRALLNTHHVVPPPEWFQAMLVQGVLLLNAALTASSDDALSTANHTSFWKPVVEKVVEEIFKAKATSDNADERGVVFAWWGSHAKNLRKVVEKVAKQYPTVAVAHVDHCNPAAQGDMFCDGHHFADVNAALSSLSMKPVDWLPSTGWNASAGADAQRMGDFIDKTRELHKLYLERLQGVGDEKLEEIAAIDGIGALPLPSFAEATAPLLQLMPALKLYIEKSRTFAEAAVAKGKHGGLGVDDVAALFLYTTESPLYRALNAVLRDADRSKLAPWRLYLRRLFAACEALPAQKQPLYRGVGKDLRAEYAVGRTVVWWGVSSCTPKLSVARGFLGSAGKRMLFVVEPTSARAIQSFSAFTGEEELVLLPGTSLQVVGVDNSKDGLSTVTLRELPERRVS